MHATKETRGVAIISEQPTIKEVKGATSSMMVNGATTLSLAIETVTLKLAWYNRKWMTLPLRLT